MAYIEIDLINGTEESSIEDEKEELPTEERGKGVKPQTDRQLLKQVININGEIVSI